MYVTSCTPKILRKIQLHVQKIKFVKQVNINRTYTILMSDSAGEQEILLWVWLMNHVRILINKCWS